MAMLFASASVEFLKSATAAITAAPLTFACRVFPLTQQFQFFMIARQEDTAVANSFVIYMAGAGGSFALKAETNAGGVGENSTTAEITANAWHNLTGVWASASSRTAWLDGIEATAETTTITPVSIDVMGVAGNPIATPNITYDGHMLDVAMWDAALNDAEVLAYDAGISPLLIRPQNLVVYIPLVRDAAAIQDRLGTSWTIGVTPTDSPHRPVRYPWSQAIQPPIPAAVAAGFTPRSYPRGAPRGVMRGAA